VHIDDFAAETASADDSQRIQERTHLLTISLGDATVAPLRPCHRLKHRGISFRPDGFAETVGGSTAFRRVDERRQTGKVLGRVLREREGG
jgi:hypothetical protein